MIKLFRCGHGNRHSIEIRSAIDLRSEELISSRVVDRPNNSTPVPFHSYRHTVRGKPVGKVGRTVEGINHPFVARWKLLGQTTLFGQDRMGREGAVDDVDNPLLRLAIRVGDKIDELFMLDMKPGARTFLKNSSALASRISSN